jgi:hypothetical protein
MFNIHQSGQGVRGKRMSAVKIHAALSTNIGFDKSTRFKIEKEIF